MGNLEITFTVNLTAVITCVIWYLAVCLALMIPFTIYTYKKGQWDHHYRNSLLKFWTKTLLRAVLLSPLFPIIVISETRDKRNNKRVLESMRRRNREYEAGW